MIENSADRREPVVVHVVDLVGERLGFEGNLSVDYGSRLLDEESVPFGLIFDRDEVKQAIQIPLEAVDVEANTFGQGALAGEPFEACCFPYAQRFLTTSCPLPTPINSAEDLERAVGDYNARER